MSDPITQEVSFPAPPSKVYAAYVDAQQHGAFTGEKAEIDATAGGIFSAYEGKVHGRMIELVDGERIVQAWRSAAWPAGVFTLVRIDLAADGAGTKLTLTHTGVPADQVPHIDGGWHRMYWDRLRDFLTS